MSDDDTVFLTTSQLAERWQCTPEGLRAWRHRGLGPSFFRPSGTPRGEARYKLADIIAYEQANTELAPQPPKAETGA